MADLKNQSMHEDHSHNFDIRELYRCATEKMVTAVRLFSDLENTATEKLPDVLQELIAILSGCKVSLMYESKNSYKLAAMKIIDWLILALNEQNFLTNKNKSELFTRTVRNSLELTLVFFQRDLRRRNLSLEESRQYNQLIERISKFPFEGKRNLNQTQIDAILSDESFKKSS